MFIHIIHTYVIDALVARFKVDGIPHLALLTAEGEVGVQYTIYNYYCCSSIHMFNLHA